jgi:hypothetical protein
MTVVFLLIAPIVIPGLVVTVPIASRYGWPIKLKRPRLSLLITWAMGASLQEPQFK